MSSSPSARRSLKPSSIAPTPQHGAQHNSHYPAPPELPALQPAAPVAAAQDPHPNALPPPTASASRKRKSMSLNQPPEQMAGVASSAAADASSAPAPPSAQAPPPQQPQQPQPQQQSQHQQQQAPSAPPPAAPASRPADADTASQEPKPKKSRTNTPWTPAEELRLKQMRDAGNSWSEIAKTFPQRTEGSVKKHWYKDMHYAEFAEDESAALLAAIKEYDANKWKVVGQKVGKPAKACEQYAKEHFGGKY